MRKGGDLVANRDFFTEASDLSRAGISAAEAGKRLQQAFTMMAKISTFWNNMTEDEIEASYIKWQRSKKTGKSIQIRLKCEVDEGRLLRMMDI